MAGEKSATFSNQMLALIFNGTTIANIAINATSGPLTNLYMAMHTADPGASGTQSTNEVAYTGYARVAVARTAGGWTVSGQAVTPVANIMFPNPTGSPTAVATWVSVGVASSGATTFLYAVPISPSITVTAGIPPSFTMASAFTEA